MVLIPRYKDRALQRHLLLLKSLLLWAVHGLLLLLFLLVLLRDHSLFTTSFEVKEVRLPFDWRCLGL